MLSSSVSIDATLRASYHIRLAHLKVFNTSYNIGDCSHHYPLTLLDQGSNTDFTGIPEVILVYPLAMLALPGLCIRPHSCSS